MLKKDKIFKISSKFVLNEIFSYLKYNYVLKLIKYNKELQQKLDIKKNYTLYIGFNQRTILKENKDFKSIRIFSILIIILKIILACNSYNRNK